MEEFRKAQAEVEKRRELENNKEYVMEVLKKGTEEARRVAKENMHKFKEAMKINYFE